MEQLIEKCKILRNLTSSNEAYEENDIYVILSTLSVANAARSPCSSLLITAIEKLRLATGISRSSRELNLIIVPHFNDVPDTSRYYLHWNNPVFCENTAVKIESVIEIFDKKSRNLNPFRRIDNSKLLTLFGPRQVIMDFKKEEHDFRIHHDTMKTAIESILISSIPKFSDFQWLVHAAIRSQNCEHCLFYLLNPLSSVKKVQKLVRTLTRGVWSPRSDMDMELTPEWTDDNEKKLKLGCWRLDPNARLPMLPDAPKSSEMVCQVSPLDCQKVRQPRYLHTLKDVMLVLDKKIQELMECNKINEEVEKTAKMAQLRELKLHRIRLGIIFLELQDSQIELRDFGFSTGNSALDRGLEAAVTKMLNASDSEFNPAGIIRSMDVSTFKLYCEVRNVSSFETEIVEKITEKLKSLVEASNVTLDEAPIQNSEFAKETCDPGIFEELHEHGGRAEDVIEISESTVSPKPKKAKIEEVSLKDKLEIIKTVEQKELLAEAYAEAVSHMNELDPSDLPLTRAADSDEFCAFCGVFIYDPSPDLSCGFHDEYQQIVNLDIKEMLIRRKLGRRINEKTLKILKQYMVQQNNNWLKAKEKNTVPMFPKLRGVENQSKSKTVSKPKSAPKTKKPVPKKRARKESWSSEEELRKSEEFCISDTFSDLPPNFDELMEEPCCSSRRVCMALSVPEFDEYRLLKPPPPPVLAEGEPRSILVTKDPEIYFRLRDNPKQKTKKKWPILGKRRRKKATKKVENQSEKEEVEEQDVSEIVAKLETETVATTSRVQHFNDFHEEDEVRMEDVLEED